MAGLEGLSPGTFAHTPRRPGGVAWPVDVVTATRRCEMATEGLSVLVSAASRYGSTAEIAAAICDELQQRGLRARVLPPAEVTAFDSYDAVVLGSAVYVGHWERSAMDLVARCRDEFADRPFWLFSSAPVGNPSGRLARKMYTDPVELPLLRDATGFREKK